ncbi:MULTISPECIES: oxidoreductase [Inquilinus]|uniref:NAD(P)-dependent dehydrogenase (Short-subunit alcohol dehydrogenase family) n=1 Tax=Inquilinus ginsengisoli TaxID=363840 RepID=A0ABU1JPB8_9PROT|nr:oxidoreductase [Inquilinus ginsengisoli]MDR6290463.1 NAD(P)-dependent dehydrogenase (short-subunit alcohol dehydrogenase family) [Inquilinus ginsengisoli]
MPQQDKPVWFITGCSTGFGREIARHVLGLGYRAVVTARDPSQVEDLAAGHDGRALVLKLDVTRPEEVAASVKAAEAEFGSIDVLVNNAGIGYFAAVEESDEAEIRRMVEVNFWGLAAMTQAVLPGMRARRRGHIVNISSLGGIRASPGVGFYNATKFAVEGLSEALAQEVAPLGIKVTLIEPSGFRTDWAGRSANEVSRVIEDYSETAGARWRQIRARSGRQPGDPVRAAAAIVQVVESPEPPLRLLLGKAAVAGAHGKLEALRRDFEAWAKVSEAADFPDA